MRFRRVLLLSLFAAGAATAGAQQTPLPEWPQHTECPIPYTPPDVPHPAGLEVMTSRLSDSATYLGFRFDTTFKIGALYGGYAIDEFRNDLRMDWTYNYGGPISIGAAIDSSKWFNFTDTVVGRRYARGYELGLKFAYMPGELAGTADATTIENYFGNQGPDSTQALEFGDTAIVDSLDHAWPHMVYGGWVSDTVPVLLASRPEYTASGYVGNDASLYESMNAQADIGKFDLTVTLKADNVASLDDSTDEIAYLKMYRRVWLGQRAGGDTNAPCDCNLYDEPVAGGFIVSKAKWDDVTNPLVSDTADEDGWRDITFTMTLPDTLTLTSDLYIDGVKVLKTGLHRIFVPAAEGNVLPGERADSSGTSNQQFCAALLRALRARGYVSPAAVSRDGESSTSSVVFDVFSSGKVPVTFLRTRVGSHAYMLLRHGRMDDYINNIVDEVSNDPVNDSAIYRIAIRNEPWIPFHNSFREVSSRVVNRMLLRDSSDTRGIYLSGIGPQDGLRPNCGDLDSTRVRMLHMYMDQNYGTGGPIPIFYANPDKMRDSATGRWSRALASYYAARDTITPRDHDTVPQMIRYNTVRMRGFRQHCQCRSHRGAQRHLSVAAYVAFEVRDVQSASAADHAAGAGARIHRASEKRFGGRDWASC